eukprot:1837808-Heterocapsa_arctica.AAC.1
MCMSLSSERYCTALRKPARFSAAATRTTVVSVSGKGLSASGAAARARPVTPARLAETVFLEELAYMSKMSSSTAASRMDGSSSTAWAWLSDPRERVRCSAGRSARRARSGDLDRSLVVGVAGVPRSGGTGVRGDSP